MTPREVDFSPEARQDLAQTYDWIVEQGSALKAGNFVERIARFCLGLGVAPERGRRLRQYRIPVRAAGYRRQATIVFRVEPRMVTILRVRRAGLDWTRDLPPEF